MKKILIAAAALSAAGTAWANTEELPSVVLTGGLAGGTLSSSNSAFAWDQDAYGNDFNNWEVTFDLKITQNPGNDSLFSTKRPGNRAEGAVFSITTDGKVKWANEGQTALSASSWGSSGSSVSVTLSYDGSILTATNGEGDSVTLEASGANFSSGYASLWTNGGKETFSNITLKGENVIPEPSAFGLLAGIGALALVASRRRRR